MRRVLLGMVLLVGSGCCQPAASMGWRFEVLKPPTLNGAALVNSGSPPLGVAGLGTGAVISDVAAVAPCLPPLRTAPPLALAAPLPSCTLEEVCRRLDALERLRGQNIAPAVERLPAPMPKPPPGSE